MKGLGSAIEPVCMYNNKCMCYNIIVHYSSMLIGDKSPAGAQSTILLDNATEISSAVQFPTNNKKHTNKNKKHLKM